MNQQGMSAEVDQFFYSRGYISVRLRQSVAGPPLINVKINDVDGVYILDSGAGQTVVDSKQAEYLKLKMDYKETAYTGGGVGAHGIENVPSYNNKLAIGNYRIDDQAVAVMSLSTAWESLSQIGMHDELFGIIGVDVISKGNAIIDFRTMSLYLKNVEGAELDQPNH